ncbi:MAG: hypothetical protein Q8835_03230, partial [Sweet potato little leaf phytoplasma]|nr:hypothetical protein [Sweet potato little leaf phytoplasma]
MRRNKDLILAPLDPEIERTIHRLRRENREIIQMADQNPPEEPRPIRDYFQPVFQGQQSGIV